MKMDRCLIEETDLELKRDTLVCRLESNYQEFIKSLGGASRQKLITMAGRIATFSEVHIFFTREYEWAEAGELDFFLLFKNPLTIMADSWEEYKDAMMSDIGGIVSCLGYDGSISAQYPLEEGVDLRIYKMSGAGGYTK